MFGRAVGQFLQPAAHEFGHTAEDGGVADLLEPGHVRQAGQRDPEGDVPGRVRRVELEQRLPVAFEGQHRGRVLDGGRVGVAGGDHTQGGLVGHPHREAERGALQDLQPGRPHRGDRFDRLAVAARDVGQPHDRPGGQCLRCADQRSGAVGVVPAAGQQAAEVRQWPGQLGQRRPGPVAVVLPVVLTGGAVLTGDAVLTGGAVTAEGAVTEGAVTEGAVVTAEGAGVAPVVRVGQPVGVRHGGDRIDQGQVGGRGRGVGDGADTRTGGGAPAGVGAAVQSADPDERVVRCLETGADRILVVRQRRLRDRTGHGRCVTTHGEPERGRLGDRALVGEVRLRVRLGPGQPEPSLQGGLVGQGLLDARHGGLGGDGLRCQAEHAQCRARLPDRPALRCRGVGERGLALLHRLGFGRRRHGLARGGCGGQDEYRDGDGRGQRSGQASAHTGVLPVAWSPGGRGDTDVVLPPTRRGAHR